MANKSSKKSKPTTSLSKGSIDNMKYEIANEFGVKLGAESTSKANGSVGGEITRRLVKMGQSHMRGSSTGKKSNN